MAQFFIGQIVLLPYDKGPRGFIPCDGRLLKIQDFPQLHETLGTRFGGDGKTTFGVPKLAAPASETAYFIAAIGLQPPPG